MPESSPFPGSMRVQARGTGHAELRIYGDIGDPWAEESLEASAIVAELAALDVATIDLRVNSYGGSVSDGLAIFNALRRHPATVTGHNDGVAASMGSAILMAADEVVAAEASVFMVHAPWGFSMGNASDMRAAAEMLDTFAGTLAATYARRVDAETAAEWMAGTDDVWFTAAEAVEAKLADRLASDEEADGTLLAAALSRYNVRGSPTRIAAWLKTHHVGGRAMPKQKQPADAADDAPENPETPETPENPEAEGTEATGAESPETEGAEASGDADNVLSLVQAAGVLSARNAEVAALFEPFRHMPHMAALERHYLSDPKGLQASPDAVSRAVLAKLGEGIEPAGRAQFDEPAGSGRRASGAGSSGDGEASEFDRLVAARVKDGESRRDAIKAVMRENPDAHLAYLQDANPRNRDTVAAHARIDAAAT